MKHIDIAEFRERGYLQELNRHFLHPLGMALEVIVQDNDVRLGGIWDFRDDPEGMIFEPAEMGDRERGLAAAVEAERAEKAATRQQSLGYVVQPL